MMKLKAHTFIILIITCFGLSAFSSSLGIEKEDSYIGSDLLSDLDSNIESNKAIVTQKMNAIKMEAQDFEVIEKGVSTARPIDKPVSLGAVKVPAQAKEVAVSELDENVVDVLAEHINDRDSASEGQNMYESASIEDELSTELEGL